MFQNVFIFGATGNVGRTLIDDIYKKDTSSEVHKNPTRIVGLASRSSFIYDTYGIGEDMAVKFAGKNTAGRDYSDKGEILNEVLANSPDGTLAFVDVTNGSEDMLKFHLNVIEETPFNIVTANKNPLTICNFSEFNRLISQPRRYGYRCSVMAGAEVIPKILDARDLSDKIKRIDGCLSGTLGYISTELHKGRKISEIIKEAHSMGYTESNPAEDLIGFDVGRKMLILGRTAGYQLNFEDINIQPFVPISEEFLKEKDLDKLLKELQRFDNPYMEKVKRAEENGNVLRYVASMIIENGRTQEVFIGLKEVPKESPLGILKGTLNKVLLTTELHPVDCPDITEARGAGLEITSYNIRRDIRDQLDNICLAAA